MTTAEAIDKLKKMDPLEPVFVLRGQDPYAPTAIASWIESVRTGMLGPVNARKTETALLVMDAMRRWDYHKVPD